MRSLLIFLKYPTPGQVKTRLAASLGDEAASQVSRVCTELTLERLRELRRESVLCVAPAQAMEATRAWLGQEWTSEPQHGRTLGDRLAHATREAFTSGARRVVVVGTDSPWLTVHDVQDASAALEQHDVALGPTEDGGYYLIGLSRPLPALFEKIAWSTPAVYAQTCASARTLGLRVHSLRRGYDVDRLEDLQRFLKEESARGQASVLLKTIETLSRRREPCLS